MLGIISFIVGTTQFVIVGILDKIAASFGVTVSAVGQLSTVFSLAYAIGTPIIMLMTAKKDRQKQLLLGLLILIVGIILTIMSPTYSFLMFSRIIIGVGAGIITVTSYATAAQLASSGHQASAVSNVTLGFSAALVFGVPIGRVVAAIYNWSVIFWGIGFLSLLAIIFVARMIPAMESTAPISIKKQVTLLKKPQIAIAFSLTLLMFFTYSVVYTYITPFLVNGVLVNKQQINTILFALGIASLIGSKIGGFLADRVSVISTIAGGMLIQAITLILISTNICSTDFSILLLMLWSLAVFTFAPAQTLNLITLAPAASGIMLSLNGSFIQFGFAAGAGIGGLIMRDGSIMAIGWTGGLSILLATIITVIFSRYTSSLKVNK